MTQVTDIETLRFAVGDLTRIPHVLRGSLYAATNQMFGRAQLCHSYGLSYMISSGTRFILYFRYVDSRRAKP